MSEIYNRYNENLNIDCECNKSLPKLKEKSNCCCEGGLPSHSNEFEILIRQLKREVKDLIFTAQAKFLCQDKKIAEVITYVKNNLSNALRDLLDNMITSGEINDIITDVISSYNQISLLGTEFNTYNILNDDVFEDINYNDHTYFRNNGIEDFDITSNGIVIKSIDKNNLIINLSSIVRGSSLEDSLKYIKIELYRNNILVDSSITLASSSNQTINMCLNTFFKARYDDVLKIKVKGKANDKILYTKINLQLSNQYNID